MGKINLLVRTNKRWGREQTPGPRLNAPGVCLKNSRFNPAFIRGRRLIEVRSLCYGNRNKLRPDGPLGSYAHLTFILPISFYLGERQQSERASRLNNRRETLLRMIESVEKEIRTCEDAETEITNQIKECEVQIQANNENLVIVEETIQNLKNKIVEHETEIESFERKLETVRFFLKKRQVELDKIKQKLEENQSSATIKRELKEKQEEHEKSKRDEDDLITKHQNALDMIRTTHVEIRHKTQDIIALEDNIHDLLMQIRQLKHNTRKNQRTSTELQEKLENLSLELEDTRRLKPLTPFARPRSQFSLNGNYGNISSEPHLARRLEYKVGTLGRGDHCR